ncbi:COX15/CtaA family protein [Gryllotalpicola ginsengisoli]|uniref:COX15/CtaA family protein n=1 Tax=Gryllotalpicola ginsengisoli TaxID=444608 RepID=UPI0004041D0B|nr:COX15/CtaA family protein [Gryllotalpicola ginsengisoli]
MALRTPLGWAADRWTLSPRSLRWATTAALVVSILIILTGGVVRVTGSGLGCPTWPTCDGQYVIDPISPDLHRMIEQTNRMITGCIVVVVGWVIVAARLQKPRVRSITRLAWSQFWLVVANAVIGGMSVLADLNPYVVALHFVTAIALLTTTALTWHRVHEQPTDYRPTARVRALSWWLIALTTVLVVVGTLVSGSGPHSGDSSDVPRMGFDWVGITVAHAVLGTATLALGVVLWLALRGTDAAVPRLRAAVFVVVVVAQALLGVVQSVTHLPEALVALHLLGAALVWVGALRVLLDVNPTLFPSVHTAQASVTAVSPAPRASVL